ncbi:MAG: hypothetical protein FWB90_04165 [Fibromonadales bacterium]|nr:hypothetical protein [Fibromonadales bacterium]
MFNSLKQFDLAFLALAMSAVIVTLAACGESGGGGNGDSSPSSSPSVTQSSVGDIPNADINTSLVATVDGSKDQYLFISGSASSTNQDSTFSKIELFIAGKPKSLPGSAAGQWTYGFTDLEHEFDGEEYCDGQSYQVVMDVYKDNKLAARATSSFTRNTAKCRTPSSSSMSSSSAVVLRFQKMTFNGSDTLVLNSLSGTRGVILANAEGTENTSLADIYYEHTQDPGAIKAGKSNVKMIIEFKRPSGSFGSLIPANADNPDGSEPHIIGTPQSTSDFEFRSTNAGASEIQPKWQYFMVRTGSGGNTWTTSDYLLASPAGASLSKTIKIVAWKVVQ